MTSLDRYRDIVPDWGGFAASLGTAEPVGLRVRASLIDADELSNRLRCQGFDVERSQIDGYLVSRGGPGSIAQTVEHWLGLFHIQQSVMALPSLALAPRPGERVLDLCAAPGGKTTHLSELMGERGPLVAVDPKEKRLRGLLGNIYRLGHANVLVIAADGRNIPSGIGFDRVLVDAPCSGEGNIRRQRGRVPNRSKSFQRYVLNLQESLLRRGIAAARPGGTIVYSTCTFAPEENEAVVDRILADESVELEDIDLDVPHAEGILEWEGQRFDPAVRRCWRVYPHHLDSGGLFMARLRRVGEGSSDEEGAAASAGWSRIPCAFPGADLGHAELRITSALEELEHQFGYSGDFLDSLGWMERRDHLWAHTAGEWPVSAFEARATGRWRVVTVGLRALKRAREGRETPSSAFLTRWCSELASARRVELGDIELRDVLAGRSVAIDLSVTGPVALVWRGMVLGRGMVGHDRGLWHELGKAHAKRLARVLEDHARSEE